MSSRWVVSLWIAGHLVAISVAAIPPPPNRPPSHSSNLADGAASGVAEVSAALRAARPVQEVVAAYTGVLGLRQLWNMFSKPPEHDQYVRVRYYVAGGPSSQPQRPLWMATELVVPAHREDRVRLFQSFRDSYRDKAIVNALDNFYRRRQPHLVRPDVVPAALPDDLAPVARYFTRRFEAGHLAPGERVVRTEVWAGSAPIPPPGTRDDSQAAARIAVLRAYYEGPVESRFRVPPYPPYHGSDLEADISWVLEYFEQRP